LPVKLIRIDRSFWAGFVGQIKADRAVILRRIEQASWLLASGLSGAAQGTGMPQCFMPDWKGRGSVGFE